MMRVRTGTSCCTNGVLARAADHRWHEPPGFRSSPADSAGNQVRGRADGLSKSMRVTSDRDTRAPSHLKHETGKRSLVIRLRTYPSLRVSPVPDKDAGLPQHARKSLREGMRVARPSRRNVIAIPDDKGRRLIVHGITFQA